MRAKLPLPTRATTVALTLTALISTAALIGALAPEASATQPAPAPAPQTATILPLPLPAPGGEPLVHIDGHVFAQPLVNNLTLPAPK
ncbi:hypothetical protein ACIQAC_27895 [Streptomyces sp. NPDC088387]|uniref:hypothetical protein n=1 Tax=Streptomyces sp. NPDC088387 TaxID=3365859 RepID=UPI0038283331